MILLSGVPYKVLKAVADSCEVLTATYIVECSQVSKIFEEKFNEKSLVVDGRGFLVLARN